MSKTAFVRWNFLVHSCPETRYSVSTASFRFRDIDIYKSVQGRGEDSDDDDIFSNKKVCSLGLWSPSPLSMCENTGTPLYPKSNNRVHTRSLFSSYFTPHFGVCSRAATTTTTTTTTTTEATTWLEETRAALPTTCQTKTNSYSPFWPPSPLPCCTAGRTGRRRRRRNLPRTRLTGWSENQNEKKRQTEDKRPYGLNPSTNAKHMCVQQ